MQALKQLEIEPAAIINTHAHLDHAGGVAVLKRELGIPYWLHREDEFLLSRLPDQARSFGLPPMPVPEVDRYLEDGEELPLGEEIIKVIHTPGHSPGGIVLQTEGILVVGDTLFAGSVGRTDLPGGSWEILRQSIRDRILVYPDETEVYPGHGPPTTLGDERRHNPFLADL